MTIDRTGSAAVSSAPAEGSASARVAAPGERAVSGSLGAVRDWIVAHDDSKLFLVLYVGLAVVLSIWISLFWLVAVVAVHFAFELVRQSRRHRSTSAVMLEALWELKLDVALVLFALVLTLYMELVLGVVGLQGAVRLGAASRAAARFAGWERTLRGVLLSADDAAQVARAVATRKRAAGGESLQPGAVLVHDAMPETAGVSWARPYGAGAWIALGLTGVCTALLLAAPWLTPHSAATALATLSTELRPFP